MREGKNDDSIKSKRDGRRDSNKLQGRFIMVAKGKSLGGSFKGRKPFIRGLTVRSNQ